MLLFYVDFLDRSERSNFLIINFYFINFHNFMHAPFNDLKRM